MLCSSPLRDFKSRKGSGLHAACPAFLTLRSLRRTSTVRGTERTGSCFSSQLYWVASSSSARSWSDGPGGSPRILRRLHILAGGRASAAVRPRRGLGWKSLPRPSSTGQKNRDAADREGDGCLRAASNSSQLKTSSKLLWRTDV